MSFSPSYLSRFLGGFSISTNPLGRPSKYKEEYCDLLIEHMARGLSFESFAGRADVRVNKDTLYEWKKVFPDFSEAYKKGETAKLLFYEESAVVAAYKPLTHPVNTGLLCFLMKNQIGWKDKVEHSGDANAAPVIQLKYNVEKK